MLKLMNQKSLSQNDPEIYEMINQEFDRQQQGVELIASENIASAAVLEAQGSILTNKYAEGYPGKRYYGGCEIVDKIEALAIERAKKLFSCKFANVQPHSGSQMNQAVFLALLKPGDSFMGLDLNAGGHLTHGSRVNLSGKWFNPIGYSVREEDQLLDMENVEKLAKEHRPKLILAGGTAYSRIWDWKKFREIADEVGAYLMVDMAHISGLVAAGVHPSPVPYAHVTTTTTHKSLRGPRGGLILSNDEEIAKKMDRAVFPGLQGGPLMHVIAAKAVAFQEALQEDFKIYAENVVKNARAMAKRLQENGLDIVSGGTDNHLFLVDLRKKKITGLRAEKALERSYIICNKNGIPFDSEKSFITSGLRIGTPAGTTRGFLEKEFIKVADLMMKVLDGLKKSETDEQNKDCEEQVKKEIIDLTNCFPIYNRI